MDPHIAPTHSTQHPLLQQHVRQRCLHQLPQGALQRADQGVEGGQVEVDVAVPHDVPRSQRTRRVSQGQERGKRNPRGGHMGKDAEKNGEDQGIWGSLWLICGVDWGWDGSFMVNGDLTYHVWGCGCPS